MLTDGRLIESRGTRIEIHPTGMFAAEDVQAVAAALPSVGLNVAKVDIVT